MQKPRNQARGVARSAPLAATALALGLCGIALTGSSSAGADSLQLAQAAGTGTPLTVTELRDCLCIEQQMSADHDDLALRQDLLNERQQELANIDQQVMEQRSNLSPQDTVGQQVLKDLMAQQQKLRTLVQNDLRPAYNTKVDEWNALVAKYNGQCVDRPRYTMDVKTAQQDLQCPKP
ncbi:MAG TPA: hypothetical protein VM639_16510 [Dongiaceae bacterium]|nr:hypothetical protein [Dongiaceae bacterium]